MDSELLADCGNAHMCCSDVSDKSGGLRKDKFINIHEQNGSEKKKTTKDILGRKQHGWNSCWRNSQTITIMKALSTKCKEAHPRVVKSFAKDGKGVAYRRVTG